MRNVEEKSTPTRAAWQAPQVRRMAASEAELGRAGAADGGVEAFS